MWRGEGATFSLLPIFFCHRPANKGHSMNSIKVTRVASLHFLPDARNRILRLLTSSVPHLSPSLAVLYAQPQKAFVLFTCSQSKKNKQDQTSQYARILVQVFIGRHRALRLLILSAAPFSRSPAVLYSELVTTLLLCTCAQCRWNK